jgi:hypothetical protein
MLAGVEFNFRIIRGHAPAEFGAIIHSMLPQGKGRCVDGA